ncbi:hypothetical protein OG232_14845 [Streptomyces sp. NBC_01411]|uniref:hypothetical protein n=1 Tax=Streptomyces sp. NBC_01411 TaxID=2903857 RepID=UPI00324DFFE1
MSDRLGDGEDLLRDQLGGHTGAGVHDAAGDPLVLGAMPQREQHAMLHGTDHFVAAEHRFVVPAEGFPLLVDRQRAAERAQLQPLRCRGVALLCDGQPLRDRQGRRELICVGREFDVEGAQGEPHVRTVVGPADRHQAAAPEPDGADVGGDRLRAVVGYDACRAVAALRRRQQPPRQFDGRVVGRPLAVRAGQRGAHIEHPLGCGGDDGAGRHRERQLAGPCQAPLAEVLGAADRRPGLFADVLGRKGEHQPCVVIHGNEFGSAACAARLLLEPGEPHSQNDQVIGPHQKELSIG